MRHLSPIRLYCTKDRPQVLSHAEAPNDFQTPNLETGNHRDGVSKYRIGPDLQMHQASGPVINAPREVTFLH